jgi:dTDP-4-amino-4,6-dideoxygalactose transaminase
VSRLSGLYRSMLETVSGVALQSGWGETWRSSALNVLTGRPAAALIAELDAHHDIEARQWWATPCHLMPAWADAPHDDLPSTAALARNVVALPFHEDLDAEALARIVLGLRASLARVTPDAAPLHAAPLQHAV